MVKASVQCSFSLAPIGPLDSARLKLDWAKRHLNILDYELAAFHRNENESGRSHNDADGPTELTHKPFAPPPLYLWALILGDAVHNLRSSLDHIAYAFAVRGIKARGLTKKPDRRTAFPLLPEPNSGQFDAAVTDIINPDALKEFQRFQPYKRRNCLWPLAELDIADKHHELVMHDARISIADIDLGSESDPVEIGLADGRTFSRNPLTGETTEHVQPDKTLSVTLEVQLPRTGGSIPLSTIHEMQEFIGSEVIPAFARFFP